MLLVFIDRIAMDKEAVYNYVLPKSEIPTNIEYIKISKNEIFRKFYLIFVRLSLILIIVHDYIIIHNWI